MRIIFKQLFCRFKNILYLNLNVPIIIYISLIILYLVSGKNDMYREAIELFYASFGAALAIISITKKNNSYYRYIGLGFLFISAASYIRIIILESLNIKLITYISFIIKMINSNIEILVIILSFQFMKKKYTNLKVISIYGLITLCTSIFYKFILEYYNDVYLWKRIFVTSSIIKIAALFLCIFLIKYIRKRENKKFIWLYCLLLILGEFILILYVNDKCQCLALHSIIKYMAHFVIFEVITKEELKYSYTSMKLELENSKNRREELNKKLKKRNIILNELKGITNRSEKRYYGLIESLEDGVLVFNIDRLSYINANGVNILNVKNKNDVLGKNIKAIIPLLMSNNSLEKVQDNNNEELILYNKDIKERHVFKSNSNINKEIEVYVIETDDRSKIMYIRDVTQLNRYQLARRKYNDYLKEEKIKNEFYSNISHELRTPINLINSALQLNEIYLDNDKLYKLKDNNNRIKQSSLRLIRTINNFIDTNKISEGYLIPNKKIYNIVEVVENASLACNKYIKKIENELIFDSTVEELYIPIDKDMIERTIMNLLSNSVKYGEFNKEIRVSIEVKQNYTLKKIHIVVQNDTSKIDKELEPYLFDEFTKLNKSYTREKEGSGLGLFLSKAIVEAHGGKIYFKSNGDSKNIFIIVLPIDKLEGYELGEEVKFNLLEEKADVEFSDIYI